MAGIAEAILSYIRDVSALPKEIPKRHRFILLLGNLFGERLAADVVKGVEKLVRVYSKEKMSRGFIDTYYGDVVIEFESNLDVMIEEAERQLKEYIAGIWEEEGKPISRVAIAADGIKWKVYYPVLKENSHRPWRDDHIDLRLVESRVVRVDQAEDFYFWLSRLLLREGLLKPTAKSFEEDFGLSSFAFNDAGTLLTATFDRIKEDSEPKLIFETWAKYLRYSYGKFEPDENLFIIHTYLAAVARLLVWAVFSKGKFDGSLNETIRAVFEGQYFQVWRIENLVEKDFYYWILNPKVESNLVSIWIRIINQILTYDLTQVNQDILKGIYQQLVDENTRHGLGEYYTPEWLCEKIVSELLPKKGILRVLDPACGSGSFLRAALSHFLKSNENVDPDEKLKSFLESVVGFDINPLAVLISKATYSIALRGLIKESTRPVQIPVYLADTLFLPKEIKQHQLAARAIPMYEIEFGDRKVELPEFIVTSPQDFDIAISCCTKVAIDLATKPKSETKDSLKSFLLNVNPSLTEHPDLKLTIEGLWDFTEKLSDLVREEKNSIWGYILRNSYRPPMLAKKFDIIIGNPPWLSYRYIEDPKYQEEVKKLGLEKYKVAPKKQKLMTQMEIATIFLLHTISIFGTDYSSKIAFVMPRGIFNADQHEKFRNESFSADAEVVRYWDLREVHPLFNVPACVAFLKKCYQRTRRSEFPVVEYSGKLPGVDLPWLEARKHLKVKEGKLRLIYLGDHTALSTNPGWTKPTTPSRYSKLFRQGATIVPRNFYFVEFREEVASINPKRVYSIRTDEEQAKESKKPYDKVRQQGQIEGRFLGYAALAKHVLPFVVLDPALVTLPIIEGDKGQYEVISSKELNLQGYRYAGKWYANAEKTRNSLRGEKAEMQDLYERLDYQGELTAQSPLNSNLVLYNAAGTHAAAVYFNTNNLDSWFVAEHKIYWFSCSSEGEGYYLSAILNSSIADDIIKPFQSLGLMGERDIEKKILELPIPVFDKKNPLHIGLASLGKQATKAAAIVAARIPVSRTLGVKRKNIRDALEGILQEIDSHVDRILRIKQLN